MHMWFMSKEKFIQGLSQINADLTALVKQSLSSTSIVMLADWHRFKEQPVHTDINWHTHVQTHKYTLHMHVSMCKSHNKWISPWPHWQLRSLFDVNSCWLSSAWSAYSTSSVILSMALWQGQVPWGKALATASCNKAPQGIHEAKCPEKSAQPFAKTDKTLYN